MVFYGGESDRLLEGIFTKHIYNNGNQIRYPINFKDGRRLKGNYILDVNNENYDIFYSGKYKFGANELYIYQAIDELLEFLNSKGADILTVEYDYDEEMND